MSSREEPPPLASIPISTPSLPSLRETSYTLVDAFPGITFDTPSLHGSD